jgi:ABC-2 type transport system permease protein
MNTYAWLIRREFWENKSIWLLPAVLCALLLMAALFGKVEVTDIPLSLSAEQIHALAGPVLFGFGAALFVVMSIYTTWYLMDCLYADRKDQSILFWKSMPISDTATVLSKLAMGLVVIPLVYFAAADLICIAMAFVFSVRAGSTLVSGLWHADTWLQLQVMWLYLSIAMGLWFLPVAGWLMLVSAWARRAVTLWTILPPLVICYVDSRLLGTHVLTPLIVDRFSGFVARAFHGAENGGINIDIGQRAANMAPHVSAPDIWALMNPGGFFSSPAVWGGVMVGAAFVAAAIAIRHRRCES